MNALPSSRFVVRGAELQAREDAAGILAKALAGAEAIRTAAARDRMVEQERGYADGLAKGAAEGARLLQSAAAAADAFLAARQHELTELAFALAARVLGALPPDAVLRQTVATALAEHRTDSRLVVRVSPVAAAALAATVTADHVQVQADPTLPTGACTLVHARGSTDLGVLDQFRAMLAAARS